MGERAIIKAGRRYWIDGAGARFPVTTIRALAITGWWLCFVDASGDVMFVPDEALNESQIEPEKSDS